MCVGKFSFADSLRWGWGKTEGESNGEVFIGLGGKKIPEIVQRYFPYMIRNM